LEDTGLKVSDLKYIVGTGYGRVNVPMANKAITEIACHAKGANYIQDEYALCWRVDKTKP
jgi:benzoyl-CoA reductase subunit A